MNNSPLRLQESVSALSVSDVEKFAEGWFLSCEISQHSEKTISNRRMIVKNLRWYLAKKKHPECGLNELRGFLAYLSHKKPEPGGRWGNPQQTEPVKPRTVKDYHSCLRTLFRWIVAEGGLDLSPMERIPIPVDRPDTIEPFSEAQITALLDAAKKSRHPKRDEALVLFLLDTGLRANELCTLHFAQLERTAKKATVEGKGGKTRPVYFGRGTSRALYAYLREQGGRDDADPVFQTERGEAFSPNSMRQMIERLGKAAGVRGVRCSPHTFRHTFAISYLRNGGNQLGLMAALGHTNVQMTSRYVHLANADVERAARQFSPVDNLKKGTNR